ncbi:MAG: type II toxin-antitoxin system Phd/YefM family antitoxin [Alphaproteobacteria bacterium]
MPTLKISAREFNQDVSRAKRAANDGPVIITERGKPSHVLMTVGDYEKLTGPSMNLADALADPGADFDFEAPRLDNIGLKVVEFD